MGYKEFGFPQGLELTVEVASSAVKLHQVLSPQFWKEPAPVRVQVPECPRADGGVTKRFEFIVGVRPPSASFRVDFQDMTEEQRSSFQKMSEEQKAQYNKLYTEKDWKRNELLCSNIKKAANKQKRKETAPVWSSSAAAGVEKQVS